MTTAAAQTPPPATPPPAQQSVTPPAAPPATPSTGDPTPPASNPAATTPPASPTLPAATNDNPFASIQNAEVLAFVKAAGHQSVESLASDAMSANQMIGVKSGGGTVVQVPKLDRAADPDGWKAFDAAIGVPENGQYGEFKPETGNLMVSNDQIGILDRNMADAGASPEARDAALKTYHEMAAANTAAEEEAWKQDCAPGNLKLKTEWGDKFDQNTKIADRAFEDALGQEFSNFMKSTGINDHPILRAAGYKLAELTAEGGMPTPGNVMPGAGVTRDQAQAEINKIETNPNFLKGDPKLNARRVQLYEIVHGG